MHPPIPAIAALLCVLAAGCSPAGSPEDERDAVATPAPTPTTTDAAARFHCEPGTQVTLDADGGGRVVLPGGQVVELSRIAGSGPTVYSGASLYLRIEGDRAWLSQGDGSNELACTLG